RPVAARMQVPVDQLQRHPQGDGRERGVFGRDETGRGAVHPRDDRLSVHLCPPSAVVVRDVAAYGLSKASRVTNPYPLARRPAITPGSAWASSMEPSPGWEPTCMSTICPGLAVSSTRAVTEATLAPPLVPCQPSVSTVHRTGTYPRSLRAAMVRASRSPYGKRNQGRGSVPKSRRSARSVARTSSWTWPADRDVKWGWVVEWLPTRWPASTIDRVAAGNDSMNVPVRKKVPGTPSARSVARIDATASAFAPAS